MSSFSISYHRAREMQLQMLLTERYGDPCPVSVVVKDHPVFNASLIRVSVAGAYREILEAYVDATADSYAAIQKTNEEVLYAAFLLMDEDEDE